MPDIQEETEHDENTLEKWLEFVDDNGIKNRVAVFKGETDADAMARAAAIDEQIARQGHT